VHVFERIAEARISEAIDRGDFDDLAGAGRPLELEDLSHVPPDLRVAYKVLRNAEVVPPEVELRREIHSLSGLIGTVDDENEHTRLRRRQRLCELHLSILMERRAGSFGAAGIRRHRP
jgi:hypothetical protein